MFLGLVAALALGNVALALRHLRPAEEPRGWPEPAARFEAFGVDEALRPRLLAFQARLDAALAARDFALLERMVVEVDTVDYLRKLAQPDHQLHFHLGPLAASHGSTIFGTYFFTVRGPDIETSYALRDCMVSLHDAAPREDPLGAAGEDQLRCALPRALATSTPLTKVRGELRVDLLHTWIEADLRMTFSGAATSILWITPAGWRPADEAEGSLQWLEISQAGMPCKVVRVRDTILVLPPHPGRDVELRVRYRGRPDRDDQAFAVDGHAFLSSLIPAPAASAPELEVTLHARLPARPAEPRDAAAVVAQATMLIGQQPPRRGSFGSWITTSIKLSGEPDLALVFGPLRQREAQPIAGLTTTFYESSEVVPAERLAGTSLDEVLRHSIAQLARLGELPYRSLQVVSFPVRHEVVGQVIGDLLLVSDDMTPQLLMTHELAHQWFGRSVEARGGEAGRWTEGVAEYLGYRGIGLDEAPQHRRGRAARYDRVASGEDVALNSESAISHAARSGLSYGKAMLLFEMLDLEIGEAKVFAYLRAVAERYQGQPIGWSELAQLLEEREGRELGAWFRDWCSRRGAPALQLEGERGDDGKLHGAIVQLETELHPAGAPPFTGLVEVSVQVEGKDAELHRVRLSGRRTDFVLPLPPKGEALITVGLDPHARFASHTTVRRPDGKVVNVKSGRALH